MHEDLAAGLRAQHVMGTLPDNFVNGEYLNAGLWNFDLLRDSFLREQAALEAARAHLIIISVHGQTDLPPHVSEWLSRWQNHKENRPYMLALLLDPEFGERALGLPVVVALKQTAEACRADFFYRCYEIPAEEPLSNRSVSSQSGTRVSENMWTRVGMPVRWSFTD